MRIAVLQVTLSNLVCKIRMEIYPSDIWKCHTFSSQGIFVQLWYVAYITGSWSVAKVDYHYPAFPESILPWITTLGKDQNSKFEVQFPVNADFTKRRRKWRGNPYRWATHIKNTGSILHFFKAKLLLPYSCFRGWLLQIFGVNLL